MQTYWKAVAGFEIQRKTWDDETVIFHTGSGDTQLLNSVGMAILDYIQEVQVSNSDILGHIKEKLDIELDEEDLRSMLDELSRSGIVSRIQA